MLLTWHNLTFYQKIMRDLRQAIGAGTVKAWSEDFLSRLQG